MDYPLKVTPRSTEAVAHEDLASEDLTVRQRHYPWPCGLQI